jgi:hypothetical protein
VHSKSRVKCWSYPPEKEPPQDCGTREGIEHLGDLLDTSVLADQRGACCGGET